jgi:Fe-S-cluster containining protein
VSETWWQDGVRFECQGSGKCCTSHGEFGFVFLTPQDRKRFADHLGMRVSDFTRKYCEKTGGVWHLKEDPKNPDCLFLKNKRCGVYEARPTQCRTWPFWPEVMNAKAWASEVKAFCPGVGKGRVISGQEIAQTLQEQIDSEKTFGK